MKTTSATVDELYRTNENFRRSFHLLPAFPAQKDRLRKRMEQLGWTPKRIRTVLDEIKLYQRAEELIAELGAEIVEWPITLTVEQLAKARLGVR